VGQEFTHILEVAVAALLVHLVMEGMEVLFLVQVVQVLPQLVV